MIPELKFSGVLIHVLSKKGYVTKDPSKEGVIVHLSRLSKKETIQSVAKWFCDGTINPAYANSVDAFLGELRGHLEAMNLPMLKDHADTRAEADRTLGFFKFGRKAK